MTLKEQNRVHGDSLWYYLYSSCIKLYKLHLSLLYLCKKYSSLQHEMQWKT